MSMAEFHKLLETLSDRAAYVALEFDGELVLDGHFTIAELESIVTAAKEAMRG